MALKWVDGFECYTTSGAGLTTAMLSTRYPIVNASAFGCSIAAGRVTGLSAYFDYVTYVRTESLTTDATLIAGVAFKFVSSLPTANDYIISLWDGATLGVNVRVDSAGEVLLYVGSSLIEQTTGLSLAHGSWYYLELKVLCNGTTGTYDVHLDKTSILSDTGVDTKEGTHDYHDKVQLGGGSSKDKYFDDFYVCDGTGAYNTDFLDPCRVIVSNPDGDNSVNWATVYPALTDHYADVDDGALADSDTTYVEDNTTGHRDLFDYSVVSVVTTIHGISINTTCKVTDVNTVDLKTVIESGGTEELSASQTISSTDYITVSYINEEDPNTSTVWDVTDLNAAHFGIEVG